MNNKENDKDPNRVSNQDMREFKSADRGIAESGGSSGVDAEAGDSGESVSNNVNRTGNQEDSGDED